MLSFECSKERNKQKGENGAVYIYTNATVFVFIGILNIELKNKGYFIIF